MRGTRYFSIFLSKFQLRWFCPLSKGNVNEANSELSLMCPFSYLQHFFLYVCWRCDDESVCSLTTTRMKFYKAENNNKGCRTLQNLRHLLVRPCNCSGTILWNSSSILLLIFSYPFSIFLFLLFFFFPSIYFSFFCSFSYYS